MGFLLFNKHNFKVSLAIIISSSNTILNPLDSGKLLGIQVDRQCSALTFVARQFNLGRLSKDVVQLVHLRA